MIYDMNDGQIELLLIKEKRRRRRSSSSSSRVGSMMVVNELLLFASFISRMNDGNNKIINNRYVF